jgi:hypothetical protein
MYELEGEKIYDRLRWSHDSSGKASASQVWSPEFKPKYHQNKTEKMMTGSEKEDKISMSNDQVDSQLSEDLVHSN